MSTDAIEPDAQRRVTAGKRELVRAHAPVLAVISLGGGSGALARYGLAQLSPTVPGEFPWGTFWTNIIGCLLIGILMVLITEVWTAHRLLRPLLGVGFLGGFTTFSTYAVEIHDLLHHPGSTGAAFGYLAATVLGALTAVVLGASLTRWLTRARRKAT